METLTAKTKEDGPVYRALTTFTHGRDGFVAEGTKTRSPRGPMRFWIVDDNDDATIADAQLALAEDDQLAAANRDRVPYPEEVARGDFVICVQSFMHGEMQIEQGELYRSNHPAVVSAPEAFATPAEV